MQSLADRGRIQGLEEEYQLVVTKNGEADPDFLKDPGWQAIFLTKCVPQHLTSPFLIASGPWFFLSNGAKIGIDTGNHPEYATQETSNSLDLLACEKAGEDIMEQTVIRANDYWRGWGITMCLFKNNLDESGKPDRACGTHESYMFTRNEDQLRFSRVVELLWLHLISRIFYCGNGWVERAGDKISFHISQRAKVTAQFFTGATTSQRPIINTRDEPHADAEKYRRIHVIVGDSIMAETAIYLRSGTTALVLDMIEEGFLTECPFYYQDAGNTDTDKKVDLKKVEALHVFSEDISLQTVHPFDGGSFNMVDIQEWYFERAQKFCEQTGRLTDNNKNILRLWGNMISHARSKDPIQALSSCTDWAAKFCFIEKDMARFGYGWDTPPDKNIEVLKRDRRSRKRKAVSQKMFAHLKVLDLQFLEVIPRGYMRMLTQQGLVELLISDEAIRSLEFGPVPNNRSCARSEAWKWYVAEAQKRNKIFTQSADWMHFSARDGKEKIERFEIMKDPYDNQLKPLAAKTNTLSNGEK